VAACLQTAAAPHFSLARASARFGALRDSINAIAPARQHPGDRRHDHFIAVRAALGALVALAGICPPRRRGFVTLTIYKPAGSSAAPAAQAC